MIWTIFVIFLGLASARNVIDVDDEYMEALRAAGRDEEFAQLLGLNVTYVRADDSEKRSAGSKFNHISPLGDIMLTEEQERQGIDFSKFPGSRWPNNEIPYVITRNDFTSEQRNFIIKSINEFNARVQNLQLKPRQRQRDYVRVMSGNGCWSYMGKTGGQQGLSLNRDGCLTAGTVQHEFMHAAGFTHEHNRHDRDQYVTVLWDNIPENWQSQYYKNDENYWDIENYDYYSVMHYPIWAPDGWGDAFSIPGHIDRNRLGQDDGVTDTDVRKINILYS